MVLPETHENVLINCKNATDFTDCADYIKFKFVQSVKSVAFHIFTIGPEPRPASHCDICKVSSIDKVGRSALEESVGLAVIRKCAAPSTSAAY